MSDKKLYDEVENRVRERLDTREQNKKFLHDHAVGGENVPRPTQGMIDRDAGKVLTDKEMKQESTQEIRKELRQEVTAQVRRAEFLESVERHNQSLEVEKPSAAERDGDKQNLRGAMKAKLQQDRQQDRGRKR